MLIENNIAYYDLTETCYCLQISGATLTYWRKTGKLPKPKLIGRKNYYTNEQIDEIKEYKYKLHHKGHYNEK